MNAKTRTASRWNQVRSVLVMTAACFSLAVVCVGAENGESSLTPAALPETSPWDLKKLYEPPQFSWVQDSGPVRSLFYDGESYRGKPTRVFAYYATPQTISGTESAKGSLPQSCWCMAEAERPFANGWNCGPSADMRPSRWT